jgi:hypothetical protein
MLRRQMALRETPVEQIELLVENNLVERLIEVLDGNFNDVNIQVSVAI